MGERRGTSGLETERCHGQSKVDGSHGSIGFTSIIFLDKRVEKSGSFSRWYLPSAGPPGPDPFKNMFFGFSKNEIEKFLVQNEAE